MVQTLPHKLGESYGPTMPASVVAAAFVTGALCLACARTLIGPSKSRLTGQVSLVLSSVLLSFGVAVSLPGPLARLPAGTSPPLGHHPAATAPSPSSPPRLRLRRYHAFALAASTPSPPPRLRLCRRHPCSNGENRWLYSNAKGGCAAHKSLCSLELAPARLMHLFSRTNGLCCKWYWQWVSASGQSAFRRWSCRCLKTCWLRSG